MAQLRESVKLIEKMAPASGSSTDYVPSRAAASILDQCVKHDITEFLAEELFPRLSVSRIEAKTGIDELRENKLLDLAAIGPRGPRYFLTKEGRAFVLRRANGL